MREGRGCPFCKPLLGSPFPWGVNAGAHADFTGVTDPRGSGHDQFAKSSESKWKISSMQFKDLESRLQGKDFKGLAFGS